MAAHAAADNAPTAYTTPCWTPEHPGHPRVLGIRYGMAGMPAKDTAREILERQLKPGQRIVEGVIRRSRKHGCLVYDPAGDVTKRGHYPLLVVVQEPCQDHTWDAEGPCLVCGAARWSGTPMCVACRRYSATGIELCEDGYLRCRQCGGEWRLAMAQREAMEREQATDAAGSGPPNTGAAGPLSGREVQLVVGGGEAKMVDNSNPAPFGEANKGGDATSAGSTPARGAIADAATPIGGGERHQGGPIPIGIDGPPDPIPTDDSHRAPSEHTAPAAAATDVPLDRSPDPTSGAGPLPISAATSQEGGDREGPLDRKAPVVKGSPPVAKPASAAGDMVLASHKDERLKHGRDVKGARPEPGSGLKTLTNEVVENGKRKLAVPPPPGVPDPTAQDMMADLEPSPAEPTERAAASGSLFEIQGEWREMMASVEYGGEVTEEEVRRLVEIEMRRDRKLDACGVVLGRMDVAIKEYWPRVIGQAQKKKATLENARNWLRRAVMDALREACLCDDGPYQPGLYRFNVVEAAKPILGRVDWDALASDRETLRKIVKPKKLTIRDRFRVDQKKAKAAALAYYDEHGAPPPWAPEFKPKQKPYLTCQMGQVQLTGGRHAGSD